MSTKTTGCPRCSMNARLQKRTFSEPAIEALVRWGDMDSKLREEPICDSCYGELRDVLIERSAELGPQALTRAS